MTNALKAPTPTQLKTSLEGKKIEAGLIGKYFGTGDNAKINITAISVLLLIISAIFFSFFFKLPEAIEYWKTILPLVTLGLGYIWGKN
jgi:hypothetical protein